MEKSHDPNMVNEAILMGEQALRYDDNNYWYYAVLVEAYKKKSDYQNAIRIQSIITQKYPKEIGVFPTLADLYVKASSLKRQLRYLSR
jgi:tetratricopeptide (TPR) repeat protein